MPKFKSVSFLIALCILPVDAWADALVVTRAMSASTIAEISVREGDVGVEIEVGREDLAAFKNLLPDESFERLTGEFLPLEDRMRRFLETDWVMVADDQPLTGAIESAVPARRVVRDEITGDPLPSQPEDAGLVLRVKLRYPLDRKPSLLSIQPPTVDGQGATAANIGFVLYHQGVAVNDFRYLSRKETVRLDWSDPWYSAFEQKSLRRRYHAPAAAFLYIENFEVRKEIVFRPKDLQDWVDLGLDGKSSIEASARNSVRKNAAAFLARHTPLKIDGESVDGTLDRVHFITRTLRTAGVVQPGEDIDINTAMLGAIFVYPVPSLPSNVTMGWDLFNERITQIPCVATDEAGGMPGTLDASDPQLVWNNYLKNPTVGAFMQVTAPTKAPTLPIPILSVLCLVAAGLMWTRRDSTTSVPRAITPVILLLGIGIATTLSPSWRVEIPLGSAVEASQHEAGDLTYSLLHNIYRAFDYRDESTVYDVLARSVAGDLLRQIYLETRQSLTLASQGGARVKVKGIELVACRSTPDDSGALAVDCKWNVTGSVGHWGHLHQRSNQYHGQFVIRPIDGQWKITAMDLLSEQRL